MDYWPFQNCLNDITAYSINFIAYNIYILAAIVPPCSAQVQLSRIAAKNDQNFFFFFSKSGLPSPQ